MEDMIKDIILDTDIGIDSDDAVALAILLNKHAKGECNLLSVTASSSREGATATIKAICDYYGQDIPIGKMAKPSLLCDSDNSYARAVMKKYGVKDVGCDAVTLIREKLTGAKGKVTLIARGPLVNVCRFLKSESDSVSKKSGVELAKEKVDALYIMGGSFIENYKFLNGVQKELIAEWNILQDISSAQFVAENFPCKTYYVPWEAGFEVYTDIGVGDNPVWYAMQEHAKVLGVSVSGYKRDSWDPMTCLLATDDMSEFFDFSSKGKVVINDDGTTRFLPENGNAIVTLLTNNYKEIATVINDRLNQK